MSIDIWSGSIIWLTQPQTSNLEKMSALRNFLYVLPLEYWVKLHLLFLILLFLLLLLEII